MSLFAFSPIPLPRLDDFFPVSQMLTPRQQGPRANALRPLPSVDIIDTGKDLRIALQNPNVPLKDIRTELKSGNLLLIQGRTQNHQEKHDPGSYQSQFHQSDFFHQIQLPAAVDKKHMKMHLNEETNLLFITLPKLHPTKET